MDVGVLHGIGGLHRETTGGHGEDRIAGLEGLVVGVAGFKTRGGGGRWCGEPGPAVVRVWGVGTRGRRGRKRAGSL